MRPTRRSVSDIAAEIILILVVLSIGATLVGYYLYQLSYYKSIARANGFDLLAYVVPVLGVFHNGSIEVVFDTGPYGVELYTVTINGTPASCTVKIGPQSYTTPALLPANEIAEAVCPGRAPALVTLVTNSGSYEVMVSGP